MDNWLKQFMLQGMGEDLKFAHYPKEFLGLKMRVSFGQGTPTRVPWVTFLAPGMSTSNGYYPSFLHFKDAKKLVLAFGVSETHEFGSTWKPEVIGTSPLIREVIENPPRYGDSWIYQIYDVEARGNDCSLVKNGQQIDWGEPITELQSLIKLYELSLEEVAQDKFSPVSQGLFYMEKQLEDFLIENWDHSELGTKFELLYEDGNLMSQQFRTSIGPIDILARDRNTGNYVVIELKRNQTSDDTVGQVTRYMGWVREHLGDQGVRGLIISGKFDEKLHYAQSMIPEIDVYIYEVSFSLKSHAR